MTEPEPLSGPDQLMHLELLIAHLRHCQDTGEEFDTAAFRNHPLMQHVRATARQRAWAIIRRPLRPDLTDEIAFRRIVENLEGDAVNDPRWQVVEVGLNGVVRHQPTYPTQDEAERAAADMANRLGDNDPTEFYAEPAEEAL